MDLILKNQLRIIHVNDISISYSQDKGIYYKYQVINKRLSPFFDIEYLRNHTFLENQKVPYDYNYEKLLPPPLSSIELGINSKAKIIKLKNNIVTINNKELNTNQLKLVVENCIKNKAPIVSIFDLDSSYSTFLDLTATIQSVYTDERNKKAIEIYNKEFQKLERSEMLKIRELIPMIYSWNYSIPHFNEIIKADGTLHGIEIDPNYLNNK